MTDSKTLIKKQMEVSEKKRESIIEILTVNYLCALLGELPDYIVFWQRYREKDLFWDNEHVSHPLFRYGTFVCDPIDTYPEHLDGFYFDSHAYESCAVAHGNSYVFELLEGCYAHLVSIETTRPSLWKRSTCLELWLYDEENNEKYWLGGNDTNSLCAEFLEVLYAILEEEDLEEMF